MDDRHTDTNKLLKKVHKVEALPNDFGKEVMDEHNESIID